MKLRERTTPRMYETISLVAQGLSNQAIADKMCVERRTVERQLEYAVKKLELDNSAGDINTRVTLTLLYMQDYESCPGHEMCDGETIIHC